MPGTSWVRWAPLIGGSGLSARKRLAVIGLFGCAFSSASVTAAFAQSAQPPCPAPFYNGGCPGPGGGGGSGGTNAPPGDTGGNLVAASVGGGAATPVAPAVTSGNAALTVAGVAGAAGGTGGVGGTTPSVASSLAFTGSSTGPMLGVALSCLVVGAGMMLLCRERRPRSVVADAVGAGGIARAESPPAPFLDQDRPSERPWSPRAVVASVRGFSAVLGDGPTGEHSEWRTIGWPPAGLATAGRNTGPPVIILSPWRNFSPPRRAMVVSGRSRPR